MPNYTYIAIKFDGERIAGNYEAKCEDEVLLMIRNKNYFPVEIQEKIEGKSVSSLSLKNKIKTKDLAIFCRQFYSMLKSGISIVNCLDILRQQTEKKAMKEILEDVYENLQKGFTFSESLKNHKESFPELLINMVEAGEVSGTLDVIMDRMASHYEKENKINNKIKSAMIYPIILSIVAVMVVIFLLAVVMPTFIGMFEGSGIVLPRPTKALLAVSNFLKRYWHIFFLVVFGIIYGIKVYLRSKNGSIVFDKLKLSIPFIKNTNIKIITSRLTRILSTLLNSGIPLLDALDIVSKIVGNTFVAKGILVSKEEVRKGKSLAEPIKNMGIFPPMVVSMIKIGEESGTLDEILDKTADFYEEEVEASLQRMITMLEPIMIVFMAVIIGFIVIAMAMPMFDMVNTVNY